MGEGAQNPFSKFSFGREECKRPRAECDAETTADPSGALRTSPLRKKRASADASTARVSQQAVVKSEGATETLQPAADERAKVLRTLLEVRQDIVAPVDVHGTHAVIDHDADAKTQHFQALVAAMLSSQTKDEVTSAAVKRLRAMENSLTIDSILSTPEDTIDALLVPVGFHK